MKKEIKILDLFQKLFFSITFLILGLLFFNLAHATQSIDGRGDECLYDGKHYKTTFCCSYEHSGSIGDCEDVIINESLKECAFVRDINNCLELPDGWQRAEKLESWGRVCNYKEGYNWLNNERDWQKNEIECVSSNNRDIIENEPILDKDQGRYLNYVFLILGCIIILIVVVSLFLRKKKI